MKNVRFPPIDRTHKSWWQGIKVKAKNPKDKKKAKVITDLLQWKIKEQEQCMRHLLDYAILSKKKYRLYRRGKNRCPRFGVKL